MTTYPTHPFAGSNSERQSVGLPGHCERCAEVGHVQAHKNLGCGDVGCTRGHSPEDEVPPGSVWADNDPRSMGRTFRVERIEGGKATCTILTNSHAVQVEMGRGNRNTQDRRSKTVRIALDRFRPTSSGYRLIEGDESR